MKKTLIITPLIHPFNRRGCFVWFALGFFALLSQGTPARETPVADTTHVGPQEDGRIVVPTNQVLTPAGRQVIVGGRPTDVALSPDGRWVAVLNLREVLLVDIESGEIVSRAAHRQGSFKGIVFSLDGRFVYASTTRDTIAVFKLDEDNKLEADDPIDLTKPGPKADAKGKRSASPRAETADRVLPVGIAISAGGALGSMFGQILRTTAHERKTLLAAGAAAGMAATFDSPVSAVLLAIELLLFEYRARSVIPVALASATAAGIHIAIEGPAGVFEMPAVPAPTLAALGFYAVLGCAMGLLAVLITRFVYWLEDGFERLPVHWMWWPAIGAVVVGLVGYVAPRTLGVGYYNITDALSGNLPATALLALGVFKFISWSFSLSSGTSGGTLAPLCTIGSALGFACGSAVVALAPALGIDARVAALVGMAALFGGASRAFLASAVFAYETTLQPMGLLPLLAGGTTSYLVSCLMMRHTLMTEKIARRGVRPPTEYVADILDQILVREFASSNVVALHAGETVRRVRQWLAEPSNDTRHQGFPVLDANRVLVGVLTRPEILNPAVSPSTHLRDLIQRPPKFVYEDTSVRQAVEHMANHDIGRLPVMSRANPPQLMGILTRSDIVNAFRRTGDQHQLAEPTIRFGAMGWGRARNSSVG